MPISRTGFIGGIGGTVTVSQGTITYNYGEVSVPNNSETVLASITVPAAKTLRIAGVFAEGGTDGIFRIYVDGNKIWQARNAWTDRNVMDTLEYDVDENIDVELRVIQQSTTHTFSGLIWGYENDI